MHQEQCHKIVTVNTTSESMYGIQYSTLLLLPYFDPARFNVVNVVHNLFLGTGKHMFKLWLSLNLLTKENLLEMERMVGTFSVPN